MREVLFYVLATAGILLVTLMITALVRKWQKRREQQALPDPDPVYEDDDACLDRLAAGNSPAALEKEAAAIMAAQQQRGPTAGSWDDMLARQKAQQEQGRVFHLIRETAEQVRRDRDAWWSEQVERQERQHAAQRASMQATCEALAAQLRKAKAGAKKRKPAKRGKRGR